ncbi:MAG: EAL domain-containing protein [Elusimicrobia bacterium]|nr:EAL domain-containing protein [Elusimicrobiota bacterium]
MNRRRPVHLLVLRFCEPRRLADLHGRRIASVLLRDLTVGFGLIAKSVLRRHVALGGPHCPAFGTWIAPFAMRNREFGMDEADQSAAITETGMDLARRMLDDELGRASAMRLDYRFGVLKHESGETDPLRIFRWLRPRLPALDAAWAPPAVSRQAFRALLRGTGLDFHLQPIVSLDRLRVRGFEALARGPAGGPLERADRLFAAASYYGLHRELDLACLRGALRRTSRLPAPYWLSVNIGPELFEPALLRRLVRRPELMRRRVFELTEHAPIPQGFAARTRPLLRQGARLALDDAGCGFVDMGMVESISPHIVKLCVTVIRRIESGPDSLAAIRRTVRRIRKAGASALAEGVETEAQLRLVRRCGFALAQGYLFGKPRPAADVLAGLAA